MSRMWPFGRTKEPKLVACGFRPTEKDKKTIVNTKIISLTTCEDIYYLHADTALTNTSTNLCIDKITGQITETKEQMKGSFKGTEYSGFLGIINIMGANYLLMVKSVSQLCGPDGKDTIYEVQSLDFLPINTEKQSSGNKKEISDLISQIEQIMGAGGYYFSYTYPLTLSYQKKINIIKKNSQVLLSDLVDKDFLWNGHLLDALEQQKVSQEWQPQLIQGSVFNWKINTSEVMCTVISRRQSKRGGTRFSHRGIDSNGYVANYVESEQILVSLSAKMLVSYVQIRGSVPSFWSQQGLSAKFVLECSRELSNAACVVHFEYLKRSYGDQVVCVNLMTDSKSDEKQLSNEYKTVFEAMPKNVENNHEDAYKLLQLDFHAKSKKGNYQPIDEFIEKNTLPDMRQHGLFVMRLPEDNTTLQEESKLVLCFQKGIVRTNCMDCLDRTNFFQLRTAYAALTKIMLPALDVTVSEEDLKPFKKDFQFCWGENGDKISQHYAGTKATTSQAAKHGKQSKFGFIQGKLTSAMRFFKGTLTDAYKQQCYCVLLGEHFETQRNLPYQEQLLQQLKEAEDKYVTKNNLTLFVCSWSVNSFRPDKTTAKRIALIFKNNCHKTNKNYKFNGNEQQQQQQQHVQQSNVSNSTMSQGSSNCSSDSKCDIVIVALQEISELSSKNFLKSEESKYKHAQATWKETIMECLGGETEYFLLDTHNMAGVTTFVFARRSLQDHITDIEHDETSDSMSGKLLNKGGVCVRFTLDDTSIAILNCHLPAGQAHVQERVNSLNYIHQQVFQQEGMATYKRDPISKTDKIILLGNLNFRVDRKCTEAKSSIKTAIDNIKEFQLVKSKEVIANQIVAFDQINVLQLRCNIENSNNNYHGATIPNGVSSQTMKVPLDNLNFLRHYHEKTITFFPTYKFDVGTQEYDSSWKQRVPSYSDRILFWDQENEDAVSCSNNNIEEPFLVYDSIPEIDYSDHKPIYALLSFQVKRIDNDLREKLVEEILSKQGANTGEEMEDMDEVDNNLDVNQPQMSFTSSF